jgi:hypothetical protein
MYLIKRGGVINQNSNTAYGGENSYCPGGPTVAGGCSVTYSGNTGTTGSSNPANNPGGSYESSNPGGGGVIPGLPGSTLSGQTVYSAEKLNPYTPASILELGWVEANEYYIIAAVVAVIVIIVIVAVGRA